MYPGNIVLDIESLGQGSQNKFKSKTVIIHEINSFCSLSNTPWVHCKMNNPLFVFMSSFSIYIECIFHHRGMHL